MDLSTVKNKLKNSSYRFLCDVFKDLQLIWANCKTYNLEESDIYNSALHMEKMTEEFIQEIFDNQNQANLKEETVSTISTLTTSVKSKGGKTGCGKNGKINRSTKTTIATKTMRKNAKGKLELNNKVSRAEFTSTQE
jgi:hypothetical protein